MKHIKQNRILSFAAVSAVYILATVVGIAVYRALDCPWYISLLVADIAATAVTFVFSAVFGNASVYDPYWSVQPIVILVSLAYGTEMTAFRMWLFTAVCVWGVRLTVNWGYTFLSLEHQDWRYTMLKQKTGALYPIVNFVGIHLVPTLIVYGCVLPAAYAFKNDADAGIVYIPFIMISFLAVLLQGVSDLQMQKYRKTRPTPFIRTGLWKYSRHPNYLGEILMWWGVALATVSVFRDAPWLLAGATANTLLFLSVSIPMADKRQSAKAGFAEYKKQTRMLLPIKK